MTPYYFTIFAVFLFTSLASSLNSNGETLSLAKAKNSATVKICLGAAVLVLVLVAGLRYYVGADYGAYYNWMFSHEGQLKESILSLDEPGLIIIASVISHFTDDGAWFIFVCAAITIILCLRTNYKYSRSFVFISLLYIFCGNWHGCFNGVRQYMAAAIVFAGHRFILEKNFWKYLLVVFIAFCVHRSAIILVVLYFVLRNKINIKNVILLAIGTAIVFLNYDKVFEFVGFLKETETENLLYDYSLRSVNVLRVLVSMAPAVFCLFVYSKNELDEEQTFYMNALIIHAVGMIATSSSAYLARIGIYTEAFVPLALSKLIVFDNKRSETISKFIIVALYAIYWYIGVSGSADLCNFCWIWER